MPGRRATVVCLPKHARDVRRFITGHVDPVQHHPATLERRMRDARRVLQRVGRKRASVPATPRFLPRVIQRQQRRKTFGARIFIALVGRAALRAGVHVSRVAGTSGCSRTCRRRNSPHLAQSTPGRRTTLRHHATGPDDSENGRTCRSRSATSRQRRLPVLVQSGRRVPSQSGLKLVAWRTTSRATTNLAVGLFPIRLAVIRQDRRATLARRAASLPEARRSSA